MIALPVIAVGAATAAYWLYTRVRYRRFEQYAHLPQLPPSLLWGHLKAVNEYMTVADEPYRQVGMQLT